MTTEISKKKRVIMPWMRKRPAKPKEKPEVKQSAPPAPPLKSTVTETEEIATSIKMTAQQEAKAEAERITSQAKQEVQKIKSSAKIAAQKEAKAEAERIISQAKQEAEAKAEGIISQAKQEIQKIERETEVAIPKETVEEKIEEPVPPKEKATAKIEEPVPSQEKVTAKKIEEPAPPQEKVTAEIEEPIPLTRDSHTLYAGEVELAIAKPVDPKMAAKLYNYLQTTPGIKLVQASGTWERGTTITVVLDKPISLLSSISSKIPEAKVTAERPERDGFMKGKRGVRRINLTLKEG